MEFFAAKNANDGIDSEILRFGNSIENLDQKLRKSKETDCLRLFAASTKKLIVKIQPIRSRSVSAVEKKFESDNRNGFITSNFKLLHNLGPNSAEIDIRNRFSTSNFNLHQISAEIDARNRFSTSNSDLGPISAAKRSESDTSKRYSTSNFNSSPIESEIFTKSGGIGFVGTELLEFPITTVGSCAKFL